MDWSECVELVVGNTDALRNNFIWSQLWDMCMCQSESSFSPAL